MSIASCFNNLTETFLLLGNISAKSCIQTCLQIVSSWHKVSIVFRLTELLELFELYLDWCE